MNLRTSLVLLLASGCVSEQALEKAQAAFAKAFTPTKPVDLDGGSRCAPVDDLALEGTVHPGYQGISLSADIAWGEEQATSEKVKVGAGGSWSIPVDPSRLVCTNAVGRCTLQVTVTIVSEEEGDSYRGTSTFDVAIEDDRFEMFPDVDGDGYGADGVAAELVCDDEGYADQQGDCNDDAEDVHPGAPDDTCDEVDNDCDGPIDEDADADPYYPDLDGDTYGDENAEPVFLCAPPDPADQLADRAEDCNDGAPAINPNANEVCGVDGEENGIDEDCDDLVDNDDDVTGAPTYFLDRDGDNSFDPVPQGQCGVPMVNHIEDTTGGMLIGEPEDCDDTDPYRSGYDVDSDGNTTCDASPDCEEGNPLVSGIDRDGDGFSTCDGDCADDIGNQSAAASIYPFATEITDNGIDDDCDGFDTCYADVDVDGYSDGTITPPGTGAPVDIFAKTDATTSTCSASAPATTPSWTGGANLGDCDDDNPDAYPGAGETVGDGIDQNCDRIDPCFEDADNDNAPDSADLATATADLDAGENCTDLPGAAPQGVLDCDPADGSIYPGAAELPGDDVDQNCDDVEDCWEDADDDNYARSNPATVVDAADYGAGETCADAPFAAPTTVDVDCNDTSASYNPEASEDVLDPDYDCDQMVLCYQDADGDGYGDDQGATALANVPSPGAASTCATEGGVSATADDCEDSIYAVNPGVPEVIDLIDNDCDGEYRCYVDGDGDLSPGTSQDGLTAVCGGATSVTQDDCDDGDNTIFPGNTGGFCSGADSDCDPNDVDEWVYNATTDAVYLGTDPATQLQAALLAASDNDVLEVCSTSIFSGAFEVNHSITISGVDGLGASMQAPFQQSPSASSVITIDASGPVTLDHISVSGDITSVAGRGGCIDLEAGDLALNDVNLDACYAAEGGAIYTADATTLSWDGGQCTNSTATSNRGGCLSSEGSFTSLTDVDLLGNIATTVGGGFYLGGTAGTLDWYSGLCGANGASNGGCFYADLGSQLVLGDGAGEDLEIQGDFSYPVINSNVGATSANQGVILGSVVALSDTTVIQSLGAATYDIVIEGGDFCWVGATVPGAVTIKPIAGPLADQGSLGNVYCTPTTCSTSCP